jgi:predicted nucleic acid-binding protein
VTTTLYLDTSSLLKIYVNEDGSDDVRQELGDCESAATSAISYVEARAAFARRRREGRLTSAAFRAAKRDFDDDWPRYVIVEPTAALFKAAGELAERHALRAYDSIHLASFLKLAGNDQSEVRFSSFDHDLNRAATAALRRHRRSRA